MENLLKTRNNAKNRAIRRSKYLRSVIDRYKRLKRCSNCQYNNHGSALDLDHKDPSTKEFRISSGHVLRYYAWKRIKNEIKKCRVLCKNCHAIKTYTNKEHLIK